MRQSRFRGLRFGNDPYSRHVDQFADTTIAFVSPDKITDTGSRLARFVENSIIEVIGSGAEDGQYQVTVSTAAQLTLASIGIANAIAGPSVTLRSKNNRNRNRYAVNVN